MDSTHLFLAIEKVCPAVNAFCGHPEDRSTWWFTPMTHATASEIAAGDNVIATIPTELLPVIPTSQFISLFTDPEYQLLKTTLRDDLAASDGSSSKLWDTVVADPMVDLNKAIVQDLKDTLVAKGVLDATRAEDVFRAGA